MEHRLTAGHSRRMAMAIRNGTEDNDTLIGTTGVDTIRGFGGNDTIYGRGGKDDIDAGDGNDTVYVLTGSNVIPWAAVDGGAGTDKLVVLGDDRVIVNGLGFEIIISGNGDDSVGGDSS